MRITSQDEYGLRCLVQLAKKPQGESTTAVAMAEMEGISVPYANKIMHTLKNKGLIDSVRGIKGGYCLNRDKKDMTVEQVLEALDDTLFPNEFCNWFGGQKSTCIHNKEECSIRPLWRLLSNHISKILTGITLADLIGNSEFAVARSIEKRINSKNLQALGKIGCSEACQP